MRASPGRRGTSFVLSEDAPRAQHCEAQAHAGFRHLGEVFLGRTLPEPVVRLIVGIIALVGLIVVSIRGSVGYRLGPTAGGVFFEVAKASAQAGSGQRVAENRGEEQEGEFSQRRMHGVTSWSVWHKSARGAVRGGGIEAKKSRRRGSRRVEGRGEKREDAL